MFRTRILNQLAFAICCLLSSNVMACELNLESYMIGHILPSDFENSCDGYRDCIYIDLKEETDVSNTYRVFVFFGNYGSYPSDDTYVIKTNKSCRILELKKIQ